MSDNVFAKLGKDLDKGIHDLGNAARKGAGEVGKELDRGVKAVQENMGMSPPPGGGNGKTTITETKNVEGTVIKRVTTTEIENADGRGAVKITTVTETTNSDGTITRTVAETIKPSQATAAMESS